MYTSDKRHRITLRLNDEQFEFVRSTCEMLDTSPSDFLRMVINSTMISTRKGYEAMDDRLSQRLDSILEREGFGRENDKPNIDNQL